MSPRLLRRTGAIGLRLVTLGLLGGAAVLSVLRVVQSGRGLAVQIVSFAPLAVAAYAVALVLLLLAAWRREPGRRGTPLLGALLAVVGLALHGWWIAPDYLGSTPPAAPGAVPLVVMSSNLFEGRGDAGELVAAVRREHVDVLVLEEVSTVALAAADADGLGELLPHRIGAPVPDDPVAGTMVLSTLELGPPTAVATRHQSWLVDLGTLTILAVHPVAPVTPEQWRADHEVILRTAEQARPDLVVGDFNATGDHAPMQALDDAGFHDAATLADSGWQPTWPANHLSSFGGPHVPPLVRIDHVLLGPALTALETHTVGIADTDHLALVASVARR